MFSPFLSIVLSLFALLQIAAARPAFTGRPYIVERLTTATITSSTNATFVGRFHNHTAAPFDYSIAFRVHDPDPLTNAAVGCDTRWSTNITAPTSWLPCRNNTSFAFRLLKWEGIDAFELDVKHGFHDPRYVPCYVPFHSSMLQVFTHEGNSVGKPPQDYVITYAKAELSAPTNLTCTTNRMLGERFCSLQDREPASFPIYAAAA